MMVKRLNFNQLRSALRQLTLEQAKQLSQELSAIVDELEQSPNGSSSPLDSVRKQGREVVETQRIGAYLYQLERIRCGKVGCKCAGKKGELHGPYWYGYWREDGKLRSRYVGKRLRLLEERGHDKVAG